MLIGFALIIVAVFLCCALLFRLSIYPLPLFVAFLAGSATYGTDSAFSLRSPPQPYLPSSCSLQPG